MATYKRGTRFGILSFARITSNTTLSDFQTTPTLTADSITGIKNKYLWSRGCQSIVLIEGDTFNYYLPLTDDNFDVDIDGFQVDILGQDYSTVDDNVGTVTKGTYTDGEYYYISFTVPTINQDSCVLAIVDQSNSDRLYYISNYIDFVSSDYEEDYPFLKWRCTRNGYGHYWEEIINDNASFYNQLRLDVNKVDDKFEYEIEQDKEALTGEIIDITDDVEKYIVLETYQMTPEMHEGFSVIVWSDTLYINDQQYVKKGGYETDTPVLDLRTKGRVELYDLDFATANKSMSV